MLVEDCIRKFKVIMGKKEDIARSRRKQIEKHNSWIILITSISVKGEGFIEQISSVKISIMLRDKRIIRYWNEVVDSERIQGSRDNKWTKIKQWKKKAGD